MKGAIIGDIAGSRFEFNNHKDTKFKLFDVSCSFTDDTVCTIAVAECILSSARAVRRIDEGAFAKYLRKWCSKYPNSGYGLMFSQWLADKNMGAFNSFGNGSAMRVSPVTTIDKLEWVLELAEMSAICTHNHKEGVRGAKAVADCIFVGRHKIIPKEDLREYISKRYGYDLDFTCDDIRTSNRFDETCQVTVPQAIVAFLDSTDFESAIRLAVSIGGDSDTIACITGSIAEGYYGVSDDLWQKAKGYLPKDMIDVVDLFYRSLSYQKSERAFLEVIE